MLDRWLEECGRREVKPGSGLAVVYNLKSGLSLSAKKLVV
jgi:hypothetical protein